ncbi:hypothetical protein BASA83_010412 [Batrachochytrium salamandrivorans]|nr:hypothetical protein BASA83_010412 [Batrachochytrium salamandrivorans]
MRIASWLASWKGSNYSRRKTRASSKAFPRPSPRLSPATGGTPTHSPTTAPISPRAIRIPARQVQREPAEAAHLPQPAGAGVSYQPQPIQSEGIKVATAGTLLTDVAASWFNPSSRTPTTTTPPSTPGRLSRPC